MRYVTIGCVRDHMNEEEGEWSSFKDCGDNEIVHPISGPPAGTLTRRGGDSKASIVIWAAF
jgi:hypothetical protein